MRRWTFAVSVGLALSLSLCGWAVAASMNGSAGNMPAYYDCQLFTINFAELPSGGERANIAQNQSINFIYQCDQCEAEGVDFVSVIDAIQGDGFNPLWQEVQVSFNAGFTPRQLCSDDQIAAAEASGEVTLTTTDELYRCSVVGTK